MNFKPDFKTTKRLQTAYYRAGAGNDRKLLMLHGNLSSSVFFLPLFEELSKDFDVIAPDLRCFGDSSALRINAKRGYRDFSDDIFEFISALGWEEFSLLGWSMGAGVGMQYTIDHSSQIKSLILVNPCSPYGFGGTKGLKGQMLHPPGIASGAGIVQPNFVSSLKRNDRAFLRFALNETIYFKPGFRMDPEWEDLFVEAIGKTKVGPGMYPGDVKWVFQWPFIAAGNTGICNAMSSVHGNLEKIIDIEDKPPILWLRGKYDRMISDRSICDLGTIGKLGIVPCFPGQELIPPQPMVSQTRYVLEQYSSRGGYYKEEIHSGAHCCWIESPKEFIDSIRNF